MAHPAVMGLNSWGCEGNTTLSVLFFPFREATPFLFISTRHDITTSYQGIDEASLLVKGLLQKTENEAR